MTIAKLKKLVVTTLDNAKAEDITVLNVRKLTTVTDIMIICSGRSTRHVKAIAEQIVTDIKRHKLKPLGVEGTDSAEWIIVDIGDIIVHIMLPTTRKYYNLEELWQEHP